MDKRSDSIHYALARRLSSAITAREPPELRDELRRLIPESAASDSEPDDLIFYLNGVVTAWCLLAVVCSLASVAVAYVGDEVAGRAGQTAGLTIGLSLCFFCLAGAVSGIWHSLFAYEARRRYQRYGANDRRYVRAEKRARPRNTSLIGQSAVAVVAALTVISAS